MGRNWSYPPTRNDYFAGAGILTLLSQGKATDTLLASIDLGETIPVPAGLLVPPAVVHVTDDYVLVAVSGTLSYLQWVCHFLGSNQATAAPFPGRVNEYFAFAASSLLAALVDYQPLLETRRLILIGHSFGAAIAQLVATAWQGLATRGVVTICFGSPRVGDAAFGDGVTYPAFRVQVTGDPVPSFPPTNWVGKGTPWTGFVGLIPATYVHAGVVVSLDAEGTLGTTDNTMAFTPAVDVVARGQFTPHLIEEYERLLSLKADPPQIEWKDPATVEEILDWQAIHFSPNVGENLGGGGMLTQGIIYFRTAEESQGWGESFVANTDISAMLVKLQALAPTRALCLVNSCEIHAVKASNIDPTRTTNSSRSLLLDTPIPGKASGTSIKDIASTLTNETMDAIDYELVSSATASRRVFPFRGVPDNWISGSKRSGDGIGADGKFTKYFDAVKKANLGFKVYDRTKAKTVLTTVVNDPVTTLLKITSAGHGLVDRQLVTIRGFKPNPMINGDWRVQVADVNNFFLVGSYRFQADASGVGTWQMKNVVADTIEDVFFNGISTRKTGRPFGQRRGKRSARLLHH